MHDGDWGGALGETLGSLAGWVAQSDRGLEATSFAAFARDVLASLPADERADALSMLATASAQLHPNPQVG